MGCYIFNFLCYKATSFITFCILTKLSRKKLVHIKRKNSENIYITFSCGNEMDEFAQGNFITFSGNGWVKIFYALFNIHQEESENWKKWMDLLKYFENPFQKGTLIDFFLKFDECNRILTLIHFHERYKYTVVSI